MNLIISYPNISEEDLTWIQSIREQSDHRYFGVVKPHVTLVFGTSKLSPEGLLTHAKDKLLGFKKIAIGFYTARVIEDDSKTFFHTFLVPTKGYEEIVKLHDTLYAGALSSELRKDIPYIPHIGIGISTSEIEMKSLAQEINAQKCNIQGSLDKLSVVHFDGTKVIDLDELYLS